MDLIIETNTQYNFKKVYCPEGHYITSWNEEEQDILDFEATKMAYTPISVDIESMFHCITEEEYNDLIERQQLASELDYYADIAYDEPIPEEYDYIESGTTE